MADYIFRRNFEYSGWADGNYLSSGRWYSQGGHWDTREEFYDTSRQFWCVNMSQLAKDYPGYIVESLLLQTWCRKKKHSNEHTVQLVDYRPTDGIKERPSMYPHFDVYSAPLAAPVQKVWPGKNNNLTWNTVHRLYKPYPIEELLERPVVISYTGVPNSRREYGWCKVIGVQAYKEQRAFPGWCTDVMTDNGINVPGSANQLLGPGHWLSEYTGSKEYLGFSSLPIKLTSIRRISGVGNAGTSVPGWFTQANISSVCTYKRFNRRKIKAIKVRCKTSTVNVYNNNPTIMFTPSSSSTSEPSSTGNSTWSFKYSEARGDKTSGWLPVDITTGDDIYLWIKTNAPNPSQAAGIYMDLLEIADIQYG